MPTITDLHAGSISDNDKRNLLSRSHKLPLLDSYLQYREQGQGSTMLFLHGMPTSSYVWRHIMPVLAPYARCIAPDLIGMGESGKPDIAYTTSQHVEYIEALIESLQLEQITLVMHGWGSVIGLDYARRHPQKIAGLVWYEAQVRPVVDWDMLSLPVQQFAYQLRDQQAMQHAVIEQNAMLNKLLPSALLGEFSAKDLKVYRQPFTNPGSRRPLWQYLAELPLGTEMAEKKVAFKAALLKAQAPASGSTATDDGDMQSHAAGANVANTDTSAADVSSTDAAAATLARITKYSEWLCETELPKLMLYSMPGFNTTIDSVQWCCEHMPQLQQLAIEDSLHFAQESQPLQFAHALLGWYQKTIL